MRWSGSAVGPLFAAGSSGRIDVAVHAMLFMFAKAGAIFVAGHILFLALAVALAVAG